MISSSTGRRACHILGFASKSSVVAMVAVSVSNPQQDPEPARPFVLGSLVSAVAEVARSRCPIGGTTKVLSFFPRFTLGTRDAKVLRPPSFLVEAEQSPDDSMKRARSARYEAVLLYVPLNFGEGPTLVKLMRQENSDGSLFVFAPYLDLEQRLSMFEAGADDCLLNPLFVSELPVRLDRSVRLRQAASKLTSSNTVSVLRSRDLVIDLVRRRVARQGSTIDLRPKEFLLLEYLVRNVNRLVTRTMILEHVWNSSFEGLTNVVDVYINALRNKMDRDFPHKMIHTNRGIGYTLTCESDSRPTNASLTVAFR